MKKKRCSHCRQEKEISLFRKRSKSKTGYDGECKECHKQRQKRYWSSKSLEEKRLFSQKHYQLSRSKLVELTSEQKVERWARLILARKKSLSKEASSIAKERFESRQHISKERLILLAREGLVKFPYMSFLNFRGDNQEMKYASLDRIDSSKPYSNSNIQVIPLWLNSAKLNGSIAELHALISDYYQRIL